MKYAISLKRNTKTGDYYTKDNKYRFEKGEYGWNVFKVGRYSYDYDFTSETLREAKESIAIRVLNGDY